MRQEDRNRGNDEKDRDRETGAEKKSEETERETESLSYGSGLRTTIATTAICCLEGTKGGQGSNKCTETEVLSHVNSFINNSASTMVLHFLCVYAWVCICVCGYVSLCVRVYLSVCACVCVCV